MNHEKHEKQEKIMYKEESFLIQEAVFEIYKEIGVGFIEPVYQECLEYEFAQRKIPFKSQVNIFIHYKKIQLQHTYKAVFTCFEKILFEIKAVSNILDIHRAQILNYLRATNLRLGFLINFSSSPKVAIERIVV
ncbi:MAG TPA: GxxExxY protein [Candidatus Cloacimonetes bacterium]|nr:GxxExxY protein [Candidatus Cloacimonadota bacterium]HEX37716.1 GxxExxY protein [Candidatus Cloacimonadota bacterium]